ncbi:MAG: hypothetical protein JSU81_09570 [Candidatus Coatesbacteria bacterium]|nr:MAG: hypothetical protein JSU81_09570 [Candidatus Coatesbacteria bacterium]
MARFRRRRLAAAAAAGAAALLAWAAATTLLAFAASAGAGWVAAGAAALVFGTAAAWVLWRLLGRNLLCYASLGEGFREAENRLPPLRRRLASAYYLVASPPPPGRGISPRLTEAFVAGVERRLPDRLRAPLAGRTRYLSAAVLAAAAAAWAIVSLAAPGFLGGRVASLAEATPAPGRLLLSVSPGDTRVGVNRLLEVEATLSRDFAGEVGIVVERGGSPIKEAMEPSEGRRWAAHLPAGADDFTYYVVAGAERSRRFEVVVVPPPTFGVLRVSVTPPAYAGLPSRELPPGEGDLAALAGAAVRLEVDVAGATAVAVEFPGGKAALKEEGKRYAGAFVVGEPGSYRLRASSPWGEAATPYYRLAVLPDAPPEVTVTEPARDVVIADTARSPRLRFACRDDFGLGDIRVVYYNEVTGQRLVGEVGSGGGRAELEADVDLIPPELELFPGDVIAYYVEAFDRDDVNGPKAGRSATYRFRFPTTAEFFERMSEEMTSGVSDLEGLRTQARRLQERLRQATPPGQSDSASRPELRELVQEQERLRRELLEASERLEEMLACAEDDLFSPELAAKIFEANRLLNEALDEESKEALRKLSEALREVDPERVRELMEQAKLDQAELERNLARVIDILKEAQREELLRNLAAWAEDLAARQREVVAEVDSPEALSRQREVVRDVEALAEAVEEAAAAFEEADAEVAAELRKVAEELAAGEAPRAAERAARALSEADLAAASAAGEVSAEELEATAAALEELARRYREGRRNQLLADLDRTVERVLTASHRTEALVAELAGGEAAGKLAGRHHDLAGEVGRIGEEARAAAEKSLLVSPAFGAALAEIGAELEAGARNYELGQVRAAAESGLRALAGLNVVAAALLEARANVAAAGSSLGLAEMIERMKALAEGQRGVNEQGRSLLSQQPGLAPSPLAQALERLAAEQALIRQGLERLAREGRGRGSETAGNLGGLAEEMEEIERELEAGRLDERLIERQEKLLERMLASTRALRVQGRSSRRRAEPAREYGPPTVAPLPGRLTAPRRAEGPASAPPRPGYVPAELRDPVSEYYRRLAGGE